jgi:AcrR family transcriptional regulator
MNASEYGVARRADIGKGTDYFHWRTRDDLFRAVLERETLEAIEDLLRALRQDAEAGCRTAWPAPSSSPS